jgi:hypothetical protein
VAGAVACLAAAALALGLAGNALAINPPLHLRKAAKNAAAIKPMPAGKGRNAALSKGATPGNGAPSSNAGRTDPARLTGKHAGGVTICEHYAANSPPQNASDLADFHRLQHHSRRFEGTKTGNRGWFSPDGTM